MFDNLRFEVKDYRNLLMPSSKNITGDLIVMLIALIIVFPIWCRQEQSQKMERKQLKIDPIEIDAVITDIKSGSKGSSPTLYYKYSYNELEYEDTDYCPRLIYKHREEGRKDVHGTTYFSVIGDTFKIVISKSNPQYSRFVLDPVVFREKYYSK